MDYIQLAYHSMKTSVPGKYIVETVRDVQYGSYYGSHLEFSGRRFFGFQYESLRLGHCSFKH